MRTPIDSANRQTRASAFTFVELLVVIAIVGMGAAMLLPALARASLDAKAAQCLYNHTQLVAAWKMYANDNNDALVINNDLYQPSTAFPISWVAGKLDWNQGVSSANTNTVNLTDPRASLLAPYTGGISNIFKCPADIYVSPSQRNNFFRNRVRSVAMCASVGDGSRYAGSTTWLTFVAKKTSDLSVPTPAASWVFSDEHADAIDDGLFYANPTLTNGTGQFPELPAFYHSGACGISFADGHAEMHKWREPTTVRSVQYSQSNGQNVSVVNSQDLAWLAAHTARQSQ